MSENDIEAREGGLSRREFAKRVGVGAAAVSLFIPKLANAATDPRGEKSIEFEYLLTNPMPIMTDSSSLIIGKNGTIKLYKDKSGLSIDQYLELSEAASLIVQTCKGHVDIEVILDIFANYYSTSKESIRGSVISFIKYLFEEGYLTFGSAKVLTGPDRIRGRGIITRGKQNTTIRVRSRDSRKIDITF
jgi:hypothetical protein